MKLFITLTCLCVIANTKSITTSLYGPNTKEVGDLIAIGDIHGSLDNLRKTLYYNKIIDENDNWIAGNRTVVQTGDLIGRGLNDKQVLEYIYKIQHEASKQGGEWVQLLGNHEWMELHHNYNYAVDGPGIGFGSLKDRINELNHGKLGEWLRTLPIIYKWNDVIFVHGGFTSEYLSKFTPEQINQHIINYFKGYHSDTILADSLLWDRQLAEYPEHMICNKLDTVLSNLNSTSMVVGHTITSTIGFTPGEIGSKCMDKLKLIDVGISDFFTDIPKKWKALHIYDKSWEIKMEEEAMMESINSPRIGLNGENRNEYKPRDSSGKGRKDYIGPIIS